MMMMPFLAIVPIIIYIVAIALFVRLCIDVSKIKARLDKGPDWHEEYKKHRFFNDHEQAIQAAKNYIWHLHSFDYKDVMERKTNYDWLETNIKPYFEEHGVEWPDLKA